MLSTIAMRVLVVDDHAEVLELVERALRRDGHAVQTASSVAQARSLLTEHDFDVLVLDLGLPDGSGKQLCIEQRGRGNAVPVLVLTANSAVTSRVQCLDAGADDFLSKPFAVAELRARVRALGRRPARGGIFRYERDGVVVDFSGRRAWVKGEEAPITAREWSILELLVSRSGRVVSRGELLEGVWGDESESSSQSLDTLIARIRRKLDPRLIRTVRGEGYVVGD
jgi:two-component system, OmpR family, response regulator